MCVTVTLGPYGVWTRPKVELGPNRPRSDSGPIWDGPNLGPGPDLGPIGIGPDLGPGPSDKGAEVQLGE